MRQGEACRMRRGDVDLNEETIVIGDSKFGKSRMVFLHPTAAAAVRACERARHEAFPGSAADTFLVNSLGRPLDSRNTPKTAGLVSRRRRRPGPAPGPVHLAWTHRPEVHLLVLQPSGIASDGREAAGRLINAGRR